MDGMENLMPREKMLQYGIETPTDVELLALFLRVGNASSGCAPPCLPCYSVLAHSFLLSADKVNRLPGRTGAGEI